MSEAVLLKAEFNPRIRQYFFVSVCLILFISVVTIPLLLLWALGWGQWVCRKRYESLQCQLTARHLRFAKGHFFKTEKTIPLENIQDLTFIDNPILRWFDLRILKVETAGNSSASGADMQLVGIVNAADLGLVIFVTPGDVAAQHAGRAGRPTTVVHSFPLAYSLWAQAYDAGVGLRSVSIQQVPAGCWPINAKIRSRMHYFLADREAAAAEPGARPLLSHADGRISETSTANVAVVRGRTITVPPPTDALPGVSLGHLEQLAHVAGLSWQARSLYRDDLVAADEVLLTSTPWCLQSAVRLDGVPIGSGKPGSIYRQLLAAWSEGVGLDIVAQAQGVA